jgi:hypothetical protein
MDGPIGKQPGYPDKTESCREKMMLVTSPKAPLLDQEGLGVVDPCGNRGSQTIADLSAKDLVLMNSQSLSNRTTPTPPNPRRGVFIP